MKKILAITAALLISVSCKAQVNNLNDTELFDGIKFNGTPLSEIMQSKGDIAQLKTFFGNDIIEHFNDTAPFLAKDFYNDNISLGFEDETDTGTNYDLTRIYVLNSSILVNVKSLNIKIGDDKRIFGNLLFNPNIKGFVFTDQDTGSISLSFKIDEVSNKITAIELIVY